MCCLYFLLWFLCAFYVHVCKPLADVGKKLFSNFLSSSMYLFFFSFFSIKIFPLFALRNFLYYSYVFYFCAKKKRGHVLVSGLEPMPVSFYFHSGIAFLLKLIENTDTARFDWLLRLLLEWLTAVCQAVYTAFLCSLPLGFTVLLFTFSHFFFFFFLLKIFPSCILIWQLAESLN